MHRCRTAQRFAPGRKLAAHGACLAAIYCSSCWAAPAGAGEQPVSFAHEIRPLLSEQCYHCHGPDAEQRQADLRLDQRRTFANGERETPIVVPGEPDKSELYRRIIADDSDVRMPPPDSGRELKPRNIELLRRWIEEGAEWQEHWAFIRPVPPAVPMINDSERPGNPIDHFIASKLDDAGLSPSPEADKNTLIRRVSLDLTGLPPTPAEVEQFVQEKTPNAYERLVDRLLESPRYGEQMASTWLDAARYADTYGYQDDGEATMWRWRDWVIEAFNSNMPFDQFTIEQLAGDLLPDATFDQRLATGFNRNHRHNAEGGSIAEEFRVEYVVDRTDTTGTVWLGLTLGCARCHDHKYDPITQREYYQLFAFFNNVAEDGRGAKEGNTEPMVAAPTRAQRQRGQEIKAELQAALAEQSRLASQQAAAQSAWENSVEPASIAEHDLAARALNLHFTYDRRLSNAADGQLDGNVHGNSIRFEAGPQGEAAAFDGGQSISYGDVASFSSDSRVTIAAWVRPTKPSGAILTKLEEPDDPQAEGYSILLDEGRVRVHLVAQWNDDALRLRTTSQLPTDRWTHIAVTYDGTRRHRSVQVYFNGKQQATEVELDLLYQGFGNDGPLRIGANGDPTKRFQGGIDDLRIYEEQLTQSEIKILAAAGSIADALAKPPSERTANQQLKLKTYFVRYHAPPEFRGAADRVARLKLKLQEHQRKYPTAMVMEERTERRPTYLLVRGQYDAHGEEVQPDVPELFPPLAPAAKLDRLAFARWLVDAANPLTARVTVNRLWQMSFNQGLVRTAEDFGVQGEPPSHPKLLDWLATELIRQNWNVQAIRRLIVTSRTYRQQSRATPEILEIDPQNRLLGRGPRFRLSAEAIRDQALYASGLLVEQLGGPSVKPYQPPGLWAELGDEAYVRDNGDNLYRRSMYMYWKRTVTHPMMGTFDAPSREVCTVRENRTNTPLQALALMNEDGMVEAARVLAERVMREAGSDPQRQISRAFQLTTARKPRVLEVEILIRGLQRHRAHFKRNPVEARKLVSVGEAPRDQSLDEVALAALTTTAGMLLNLDEVVTQH